MLLWQVHPRRQQTQRRRLLQICHLLSLWKAGTSALLVMDLSFMTRFAIISLFLCGINCQTPTPGKGSFLSKSLRNETTIKYQRKKSKYLSKSRDKYLSIKIIYELNLSNVQHARHQQTLQWRGPSSTPTRALLCTKTTQTAHGASLPLSGRCP